MTQEKLKSLLKYDKETGIFVWDIDKQKTRKGKKAGYIKKESGYLMIMIDGKNYRGHHLAWLYEYGYLPKEIDHINHIRSDNRISNLREVTRSENLRNQSKPKNKSGYYGVYWSNTKNKWYAQIFIKRKSKHLGYFRTKEEAIKKRKSVEAELNYHKNHGK